MIAGYEHDHAPSDTPTLTRSRACVATSRYWIVAIAASTSAGSGSTLTDSTATRGSHCASARLDALLNLVPGRNRVRLEEKLPEIPAELRQP